MIFDIVSCNFTSILIEKYVFQQSTKSICFKEYSTVSIPLEFSYHTNFLKKTHTQIESIFVQTKWRPQCFDVLRKLKCEKASASGMPPNVASGPIATCCHIGMPPNATSGPISAYRLGGISTITANGPLMACH